VVQMMMWKDVFEMSWWEMSWCIWGVGGFYHCGRSGDSRQSQVMLEFSEFIFVQGLMDIPLVGRFYLV
jgi:hypothetical protein